METQTNAKGELLLNVEDVAKELIGEDFTFTGFSRYNGGWIKYVTGLNKEKTDGYSILGEFVKAKKTWVKPGLYLDCSIDGTRSKFEYRLHLFIICKDGSVKQVGEELISNNWAVELWSNIEKVLKNPDFTNPAEKSRMEVLKEEEKRLMEELEKIRSKIQAAKETEK